MIVIVTSSKVVDIVSDDDSSFVSIAVSWFSYENGNTTYHDVTRISNCESLLNFVALRLKNMHKYI